MPNIQKIMNEEIRRLARKEARNIAEPLLKNVSELKREIAALRKQLKSVSCGTAEKALEKNTENALPEEPETSGKRGMRLSGPRIVKIRKTLGLSRKQFADLLDVYFVSIANWETGKTAPRNSMKKKIETVAKMGKRALKAALEEKGIVPRHLKSAVRTKAPKAGKKDVPAAE